MRRLMLKTAGEIGVKSPRTRRRFIRTLRENVRLALARAGVGARIAPGWNRLFVETDEPEAARAALTRVFGLHSVAEVAGLEFADLADLVDQAAAIYRERVSGRTFAVRARRAGDHPFRSHDVNVALGSALLPASAGVDLDDPEIEVPIEILDDRAYAVLEFHPGAGGLPLGTGGRALALFSGGFDSPVAAWMGLSRGTVLDLVVFDIGGCAQTDAALTVAKELVLDWAPGVEPRAHVVDLLGVVAALTQRVEPRLRQVLLKRAMYRAAALLARTLGAEALLTGESLGQASTQTLSNLVVTEEAVRLPVLRPLVGMGKEEIVDRSRRVGTHDVSARVKEYCSISAGPVETAARLSEVKRAEGHVEDSLLRAAVDRREEVDLVEWTRGPLPDHVVEERPDGATVVDVRELDEGPTAGDLRLPFSRVEEWTTDLSPDETYLFVCSVGIRSEMVARELRERGFRAYCLAGGIPRLGNRAA